MTTPWPAGENNNIHATAIVMDPTNYQVAYVLDNTGRIWCTTDGGATAANWTELTGNLGGLTSEVNTLALCPGPSGTTGGGYLFAGGYGGVFRLDLTPGVEPIWSLFGVGLPNVHVTDLHYIPPNPDPTKQAYGDLLLAGTFGRGAWEIPNVTQRLASQGQAQLMVSNATILVRTDPDQPHNAQFLLDVAGATIEPGRQGRQRRNGSALVADVL